MAAMLAVCLSAAANAKEMGVMIKQNDWLFGPVNLYFTSHAFKLDCLTRGVFIIGKAPSWKLYMGNKKAHRYFECTPQEVVTNYAPWADVGGHPIAEASWHETAGPSLNGLATRLLQADLGPTSPKSNRSPRCWKRIILNYELLSKPSLPVVACDVICKLKRLPPKGSVPLNFHYCDKDGNPKTGLETLSLEKAPIDDSIFTCPTGWQKLKSMNDLLFDNPTFDVVKDMLEP